MFSSIKIQKSYLFILNLKRILSNYQIIIVDKNLNYGIIGNCSSAALINSKASIDWCCLPKFDSSSVFAKILDDEKGGGFWIETKQNFIFLKLTLRTPVFLALSSEMKT